MSSSAHNSVYSFEGVNLGKKCHNFKQVAKMNKRFLEKMESEAEKKAQRRAEAHEAEMATKFAPVDKKDQRNMARREAKARRSEERREKKL